MSVERLQALLEQGVTDGVFPSAQAVVRHQGRVVFEGSAGACDARTRFDLASLTKVMGTTSAFLALWAEGKVGPNAKVARFFPGSPLAEAEQTVADLLYHRSGLPAGQPFFGAVMRAVPELRAPDCPAAVREEVRREVVTAASRCRLERLPGTEAVYSDIGFILLGEILAKAADRLLDALVSEKVMAPLGLGARFHRLTAFPEDAPLAAPTGNTRPREPAPGQEKKWPFEGERGGIDFQPTRSGEVDDDNCWAMDGVSGHAGLFGTADEVARFGQAVLDGFTKGNPVAPAPLWRLLLAKDGSVPRSTRAMGFDTPEPSDSSAGRWIGAITPGAVGHLGFTGCGLWVDLARGLVVALVTNRVALGRANLGLRAFRPRFHDAVVESLGLERMGT